MSTSFVLLETGDGHPFQIPVKNFIASGILGSEDIGNEILVYKSIHSSTMERVVEFMMEEEKNGWDPSTFSMDENITLLKTAENLRYKNLVQSMYKWLADKIKKEDGTEEKIPNESIMKVVCSLRSILHSKP